MSCDPAQASANDGDRLLVSKKQRDLLFERIMRNLSRVDDLLLATQTGDSQTAERLGSNLCHEVTLVTKDLGWGARRDGSRELSTSPLIVRDVLERLRDEAKVLDPHIDLRDDAIENQELMRTCDELLVSLRTR